LSLECSLDRRERLVPEDGELARAREAVRGAWMRLGLS